MGRKGGGQDKPLTARAGKKQRQRDEAGYDWHSGSDDPEDKQARHDKSGRADPRNARTRRRELTSRYASSTKSETINYLKALFDTEFAYDPDAVLDDNPEATVVDLERGRLGGLEVHMTVNSSKGRSVMMEKVPFAAKADTRSMERQSKGARGKGKDKRSGNVAADDESFQLQITLPPSAVGLEIEQLVAPSRRDKRFLFVFREMELTSELGDHKFVDVSRHSSAETREDEVGVAVFELNYTDADTWTVERRGSSRDVAEGISAESAWEDQKELRKQERKAANRR